MKEQVEVADATSFLACGKEHILLIDQEGTLRCKGALSGMEMLDSKHKTKLVYCGEYCCAVLTEDGIVDFYGHGPIPPFHSSCLTGVVEIAFGQEYFLALMHNGSVLYYDFTSMCYESLLKDNKKAIRIATGKSMAFAITETFELLQLCDKGGRLNSPSVVPVPPVKDVSCGSKHVLALTLDNKVYAWGKNKQGQLGLKDRIEREHPTLIASFALISRLPCGIVAGKNHSVVQVDGNGLEYCYVFGNITSRDPSDPLQNLLFTVF
jgi:alpha-tubulin suppressor-like RCC1 family protein